MDNTVSRKEARAALLKQRKEERLARQAREQADLNDLTEFTVRVNQAGAGTDEWLASKIERAKTDAAERRRKHRVAAGAALQNMRQRGVSVAEIAEQTNSSINKVREFLRLATEDATAQESAAPTGKAQVVALPKPGERSTGGGDAITAAAGAH